MDLFFLTFIPNKLFTFNDRDYFWTTEHFKGENNWQNNIYKKNLKIGKRRSGYIGVQNARGDVSNAAFKRKEYHNYLAITSSDSRAKSKTYSSIMRTCFKGKKVPIIPPIFINKKLVPRFKAKAKYFNDLLLVNAHMLLMTV